jgi:cytochrome c biogenesis protein CcdA
MVFVRHKDRALLLGMFFILGILAIYFLIGLSASWFMPWLLGSSRIISLTAAIAVMLIGLTRFLKIFSLSRYLKIKRNWSKTFGELVRGKEQFVKNRISSPLGSFILGILSSFFLLPCAYRPYLVTTGIMLKSNIVGGGRFFLILAYNLIFIIPMTVLVSVICFGSKSQKLNQWEEKNRKLVDALVSGVLIFVGIYLIQNWI